MTEKKAKIDLKTPLMGAAAGAVGYMGARWAGSEVVRGGMSTVGSTDVVQRGSGRDYSIVAGNLAWDPRWDAFAEQHPRSIRDRFGRTVSVGSAAAAFAAYDMAVAWSELTNRWGRILERTLSVESRERMLAGRRRSGAYDTSQLKDGERAVLVYYLDGILKSATAFRILSRMYRAAGLRPHTFPHRHRGDHDLRRIVSRGAFNPLVGDDLRPSGFDAKIASDWEAFGILAMRAVLERYGAMTSRLMSRESEQALRESIEDFTGTLGAEGDEGMGVSVEGVVAGVLGVILAHLMGLVVPVLIIGACVFIADRALPGVFEAWGVNLEFSRAQASAYEDAAEDCRGGDQEACDLLPVLAEQADHFRVGLLFSSPIALALVGVPLVGGAAWLTVRWFRRRRGLTGRRRPRKLLRA